MPENMMRSNIILGCDLLERVCDYMKSAKLLTCGQKIITVV